MYNSAFMSIGPKAKSAITNTKEFVGERADRLLESPKTALGFALGNLASATACAVIAIENDSQPIPNDKITVLALCASGISAMVSGINWQQYHIERERQPDQH